MKLHRKCLDQLNDAPERQILVDWEEGKAPKSKGSGQRGKDELKDYKLVKQFWDPFMSNLVKQFSDPSMQPTPTSDDKAGGEIWPPRYSALSDEWVYLVSKFKTVVERRQDYPLDFTSQGHLALGRIPEDPAPIIWAHHILFYPVYRGHTVLCGRHAASIITWKLHKLQDLLPTGTYIGLVPIPDEILNHPDFPFGSSIFRYQDYHDKASEPLENEDKNSWVAKERELEVHDKWTVKPGDLTIKFNSTGYSLIQIQNLPNFKRSSNELNPKASVYTDEDFANADFSAEECTHDWEEIPAVKRKSQKKIIASKPATSNDKGNLHIQAEPHHATDSHEHPLPAAIVAKCRKVEDIYSETVDGQHQGHAKKLNYVLELQKILSRESCYLLDCMGKDQDTTSEDHRQDKHETDKPAV